MSMDYKCYAGNVCIYRRSGQNIESMGRALQFMFIYLIYTVYNRYMYIYIHCMYIHVHA